MRFSLVSRSVELLREGQAASGQNQGGNGRHGGGPGGRGGPGGPAPVVAGTVEQKDVPIYLNGIGTVQAYNTVVVHPQISGYLVKVNFKEGQDVKKGDVLGVIDPRPYQAQLDQAVARKNADAAQLANARAILDRDTDLLNKGMPFIRYRIEDVGVPSDRVCPCGRGLPLMERVTGRVADYLKRERQYVSHAVDALTDAAPFRKTADE